MLGQDPPETYDDDAPLTRRNIKSLEYDLKCEIAESMIWAQYNRAKGDSPNGFAQRHITDAARMLRKLLRQQPNSDGEHYSRALDMKFDDDVYCRLEFEGRVTAREIIEELHRTGSKPEVRL